MFIYCEVVPSTSDGLLNESLSSVRDFLCSVNLTTFEVAYVVSLYGNSVAFLGVLPQLDGSKNGGKFSDINDVDSVNEYDGFAINMGSVPSIQLVGEEVGFTSFFIDDKLQLFVNNIFQVFDGKLQRKKDIQVFTSPVLVIGEVTEFSLSAKDEYLHEGSVLMLDSIDLDSLRGPSAGFGPWSRISAKGPLFQGLFLDGLLDGVLSRRLRCFFQIVDCEVIKEDLQIVECDLDWGFTLTMRVAIKGHNLFDDMLYPIICWWKKLTNVSFEWDVSSPFISRGANLYGLDGFRIFDVIFVPGDVVSTSDLVSEVILVGTVLQPFFIGERSIAGYDILFDGMYLRRVAQLAIVLDEETCSIIAVKVNLAVNREGFTMPRDRHLFVVGTSRRFDMILRWSCFDMMISFKRKEGLTAVSVNDEFGLQTKTGLGCKHGVFFIVSAVTRVSLERFFCSGFVFVYKGDLEAKTCQFDVGLVSSLCLFILVGTRNLVLAMFEYFTISLVDMGRMHYMLVLDFTKCALPGTGNGFFLLVFNLMLMSGELHSARHDVRMMRLVLVYRFSLQDPTWFMGVRHGNPPGKERFFYGAEDWTCSSKNQDKTSWEQSIVTTYLVRKLMCASRVQDGAGAMSTGTWEFEQLNSVSVHKVVTDYSSRMKLVNYMAGVFAWIAGLAGMIRREELVNTLADIWSMSWMGNYGISFGSGSWDQGLYINFPGIAMISCLS